MAAKDVKKRAAFGVGLSTKTNIKLEKHYQNALFQNSGTQTFIATREMLNGDRGC